ncbi:unnamed protein product [Phytophthora lilii]|uniref:Unnamed protein product n=1 Tax=Phytophthora lilii TaxID=2077276 RepID=A0A9W7DA12_9STRA|nr:unnamed protein product [Phytophthora lilii]
MPNYEGGGVYHGEWMGTPVDVRKVIDREGAFFEREGGIWSGLSHPHIASLLGVCESEGGDLLFVTEPAECGNMVRYLNSTTGKSWQVMLQVGYALEYLHERGIVHAGVKPDNIRVRRGEKVKLTGFEYSMTTEQLATSEANVIREDFRWHAPERLAGSSPSLHSDVYSFAMCIILAISGQPPYGANVSDSEARERIEIPHALPERHPGFEDDEWELVEKMYCLDPKKRFTRHKAIVQLTQFANREKSRASDLKEDEYVEAGMDTLLNRADDVATRWPDTLSVKDGDVLTAANQPPKAPCKRGKDYPWAIPQHEVYFNEHESRNGAPQNALKGNKIPNRISVLFGKCILAGELPEGNHRPDIAVTGKLPNIRPERFAVTSGTCLFIEKEKDEDVYSTTIDGIVEIAEGAIFDIMETIEDDLKSDQRMECPLTETCAALQNIKASKGSEHWQISSANVKNIGEPIGNGAFADIYRGEFAGTPILQSGLQAMHAKGIVHNDLNLDNFLVAADGSAKVSDFDLSAKSDDAGPQSRKDAGTPQWTAPEWLEGKRGTKSSDTYVLQCALLKL